MPENYERKKITMQVDDKCKCKYEIEVMYVDGVWRLGDLKKQITIQFFLNNEMYAQKTVYHVPRVGDELRLRDGKFYIVQRVVWIYDEDGCPHSRANIEIRDVS